MTAAEGYLLTVGTDGNVCGDILSSRGFCCFPLLLAYLVDFSPMPCSAPVERSTSYGCGFIALFVFLPGGYASLVLLMDTRHSRGEQTRTERSS